MISSVKGVWRDVVYDVATKYLFSAWDVRSDMAPVAQQIWDESSGEVWQELGDQFWGLEE